MISSIHLEFFKCFRDLHLAFAPLTVLTGVNAAGKSSAIQPLVLLHQTLIESELSKALILNGPLIRLGRFGDVIDEVNGRDSFSIEVSAAGASVRWTFRSSSKEQLTAPLYHRLVNGVNESELQTVSKDTFFPRSTSLKDRKSDALGDLEKALVGLLYLSTERIGPRETYRADTSFTDKVELGSGGELTPWFLYQNRERGIQPSLCLNATKTLARQVEARLADFFPGAALELRPVEGTNLVTLLIRTNESGRFHRPQNVGYGLTNILPILAACLAAEPGTPVIIENPEAHLHPAAQARMGRFLAEVANAGAQVIVETHSDHILNGIRRAVKDEILSPDSVAIHFFNRTPPGSEDTNIVSPVMNSSGIIDHWPPGFFDQFDQDLEALTDWRA